MRKASRSHSLNSAAIIKNCLTIENQLKKKFTTVWTNRRYTEFSLESTVWSFKTFEDIRRECLKEGETIGEKFRGKKIRIVKNEISSEPSRLLFAIGIHPSYFQMWRADKRQDRARSCKISDDNTVIRGNA